MKKIMRREFEIYKRLPRKYKVQLIKSSLKRTSKGFVEAPIFLTRFGLRTFGLDPELRSTYPLLEEAEKGEKFRYSGDFKKAWEKAERKARLEKVI